MSAQLITLAGASGGNISWCTQCAASAWQHYSFLQPLRQWHNNNEYKLNPLLPWHRTSEQPNRKDVFCRGRIKLRYSTGPGGSSETLRVQYCVLKEACKTETFVWGEDFCWLQVSVWYKMEDYTSGYLKGVVPANSFKCILSEHISKAWIVSFFISLLAALPPQKNRKETVL